MFVHRIRRYILDEDVLTDTVPLLVSEDCYR